MAGETADDEAAWRDLVAQYGAPGVTGGAVPWPVREELSGEGAAAAGVPGDDTDPDLPPAQLPGWDDPVPGVIPAPPRLRIIRPAQPPQPPPADDSEHFVPPTPPPLPRLDPISKGAWTALFGGPGYLLLAVMLGWQVPGWAAFAAVGAFVGGFAALVVRMNDRPPADSGPDDGAVV
ncbi:MAG TPA: hypothetical protein VIX86_00360 [Streptosporangiaceae bacterium]